MAFRLPTFNLSVNLWTAPDPVTGTPTRAFMANLARGERDTFWNYPLYVGYYGMRVFMQLLCPKGTDIYPNDPGAPADLVEVPAGSGRYYQVAMVDDVGKGFANEYRIAWLLAWTADSGAFSVNPWGAVVWPRPIP
jgi:hypothetical protein